MVGNQLPRARPQIPRPRVVPQARPQMQHLVERRRRQRLHIRKPRHEPLVVRNHRGDLRLLQHHLRHPHAVRRGILLPGQIVAAVDLEPGEQALRELFGFQAHLPNNPSNPFFLSTS